MKYILAFRNLIMSSLLILFIGLSSCEKKIFEEPFQNVEPEAAFSTAERIEKTAIGMYDALQNREFLGGHVLIYGDIRGTDVNIPSYFGNMPQFNITSADVNSENCWKDGFRTIYETNYFMQQFQKNSAKVSPEKVNSI